VKKDGYLNFKAAQRVEPVAASNTMPGRNRFHQSSGSMMLRRTDFAG
jgi:hypothetical protein